MLGRVLSMHRRTQAPDANGDESAPPQLLGRVRRRSTIGHTREHRERTRNGSPVPPTHPAVPSADVEPSPTVKRVPSLARMLSRRRSRARGRTASAALPSDSPLPASWDAELQASLGVSRACSTPTLDAPSGDTSSPAWARPPGVFSESPASSGVQLGPTPQEAALPPRVATPAFAATRWSASLPPSVDVSMFDPALAAPPVPPRSLQRKPSFRDRLRQLQRRRSNLQRESPASGSTGHGSAADYSGSSAPSEPQPASTEPETPEKSAYCSRRYPLSLIHI